MKSIPTLVPLTQGSLHFRYLALASRTITSTSMLPAPALLSTHPCQPPSRLTHHANCSWPSLITSCHPGSAPPEQGSQPADSRATYQMLLQQSLAHPRCSITILTNTLRDHKVERESAKTRQTNTVRTDIKKRKEEAESQLEKRQSSAGTCTGNTRHHQQTVLLGTVRTQRTPTHCGGRSLHMIWEHKILAIKVFQLPGRFAHVEPLTHWCQLFYRHYLGHCNFVEW